MAIEWWICPAAPTTRRVGRSIVILKYVCIISAAKYAFYRIKKVFWQCSDIIVRIHVFIENDQIANTMVANDPHTITDTIRFLLTMRRHFGIYFPRLNGSP